MKRIIRWTVALVLVLACTAAAGQTAEITGPDKGAAGYPVRFQAVGPEGATFEWSVVPIRAARSLSPDDDGRSLVFANPNNGTYVLLLVVGRGTPNQTDDTHNLTLTDGAPPDNPDPPPLPPPLDLSEYTKRLTDDVRAKGREFGEVSGIFFALAKRIRKEELRGSQAIVGATADRGATAEALFGKEGDSRDNWQAWYEALRTYLLGDMVLISPGQWADAFETIGRAVKR